jgi:predicted PurR-regulated permease PerM
VTHGPLRSLAQIALVASLLFLTWQLSHLLLLVFGSVVVATILRGCADVLTARLLVPRRWSLLIAGLVLLALIGGTATLLGAQIASQLEQLGNQLTANLQRLKDEFEAAGFLDSLKDSSVFGALLGRVTSFGTALLGAVADAALVIVAGIYIAIDPGLYRRGVVMLFPKSIQPRLDETMATSGRALSQWLLVQLIAMGLVGALSGVGLYLIGVPSPLALALIAAVTEFIPYLGPWLGALPALVIASSQGTDVLLWTAALYLAIQQLEAYVISPLLARRLVSVPPAVGLFAVVAFGLTFGPFGVILAFPLTVVTMVMVAKLYLKPELEVCVAIPGEDPDEAAQDARARQEPSRHRSVASTGEGP